MKANELNTHNTHSTFNVQKAFQSVAIFAFFTLIFSGACFIDESTAFAELQIDVTSSTLRVDGPETITLRNVAAFDRKYWVTFRWNKDTLVWETITGGEEVVTPPADPNMVAAQKMLGNWEFRYAIGTYTFSSKYYMTQVRSDLINDEGGYTIVGSDSKGDLVVALHFPEKGYYALLDKGISIDLFYIFTISGNSATGCYYHISHSTGEMTRCYAMAGVKSSARFMSLGRSGDEHGLSEAEIQAIAVENDLGIEYKLDMNLEHRQIYDDLRSVIDVGE
jgi:hypothetical protein